MSLITWDQKDNTRTLLSEKQKDSVFELASSDIRPYPTKYDDVEDDQNLPDKNTLPIQLATQFYSWLGSIENELNNDDEETNQEFLAQLNKQEECCIKTLNEIDHILNKLNQLKVEYTAVATKTNALHEACEHLLGSQTTLMEKAKSIEEAVHYFNNLDSVQVKLSSPNVSVSVESFQPILNQINKSLNYLRDHPEYKEAATFHTKFQQALAKAMGLIRTQVTKLIDKTISQLMEQRDSVNKDNAFTLLYGKFRVQGSRIRVLMELVEEHREISSEYGQTIADCQSYYLSKRLALVQPLAEIAVNDLATKYPRDHCAFLRSGCALMARLCEDEMQLFQQFFPLPSTAEGCHEGLSGMLSRVCSSLYDGFRPFLIHVNHLETLSELCSIIKIEMIEEHVVTSRSDLTSFADLCRMLLADIQERLVYRTHVYIRTQIAGYNPSAGDLAYPDKLEMMMSIATGMSSGTPQLSPTIGGVSGSALMNGMDSPSTGSLMLSTSDSGAGSGDLIISPGPNMSLAPADLHGMWYPTVRRSLVCLSKLSRCLDITSFQGLAQDCLSQCVHSLLSASTRISQAKTQSDGQLFLIKHLLILREQVLPFNIEFSVKETSLDFTKFKSAATLLTSRSRILALDRSNSILRFLLETPDIVEVAVDSRRQVDGQLKLTCETFIQDSIATMAGRVADFVTKVKAIEELNTNATSTSPQVSLLAQPFAQSDRVADLVSQSYRELTAPGGKLANLLRSLHLYLVNPDTEHILFRPIRTGILRQYRLLATLLDKYYSEEDRMIIACPSEEQLNLVMQIR